VSIEIRTTGALGNRGPDARPQAPAATAANRRAIAPRCVTRRS
jgi:hypothetical protein